MTQDDHCRDFDFQHGRWKVHHRRLKERLAGCTDWVEFTGNCEQRPVLGGNGNVEDNLLHLPEGDYRAVALRAWDADTASWAIWWLDGRSPHSLDVPVIGRFEDGVGCFYAEDEQAGRAVRVRFLWLDTGGDAPRWEQAFSVDGGESWETNWTMQFSRAREGAARAVGT